MQKKNEEIEKENKLIYHQEKIPEKKLDKLERFDLILSNSKEIQFPLKNDFVDLFYDLSPINVQDSLQNYKSNKAEIFESLIKKIE